MGSIRSPLGLLLALAVVFGISVPDRAAAFGGFSALVPNRSYAVGSSGTPSPCITCHDNADGGTGCEPGGTRPCLNSFGRDFRHLDAAGAVDRSWSDALGAQDSDGDGFTNAQELQALIGSWTIVDPSPGNPDYVTRPGSTGETPGLHEVDGDGYCWVGRDTNDDGDCVDAGEKTNVFDCNDSAAAVNSGATEICTDAIDNDCDGLSSLADSDCAAVADNDGDSYCGMGRDGNDDGDCLDAGETSADVDCDDDQVTVYPGAAESCSDDLDNDCDGDTDLDDSTCTAAADEDGDRYCPVGRDLNNDGDCLDASEQSGPSDCNDEVAAVRPGVDEICFDTYDNDCDGDVNLDDSECASVADADDDGYCPGGRDINNDGDCGDDGEASETGDCRDNEPEVNPGEDENCLNALDDDCDGDANLADADCATYLDSDEDGYCGAGEDLNRDGDCVDAGEPGGFTDCNDASADINPESVEICTSGEDDDCDGSRDAADSDCLDYADTDGDGFCVVGRDGNDDGDCADEDEQEGPGDCDIEHITVYPGAPEHCLDNRDNDCDGAVDRNDSNCSSRMDLDGDGYCAVGQDLSDPKDADCSDPGENVKVSDCNDNDPEVHPSEVEAECRDTHDNDCDGKANFEDDDCEYLFDRDGDGFCGRGYDSNTDGDCLDVAEETEASDCDDANPGIYPGVSEVCDDSADNDCDGRSDSADTECHCARDSDCVYAGACGLGECVNTRCVYDNANMCPDGGVPDGGMTGNDSDDDGCSASPGSAHRPTGWWLAALVGMLALRGRSRRRRRIKH